MILTIEDLDKIGRILITKLRHDSGSPKGKVWCDAYHDGLAIMIMELKKELKDYEAYCDNVEGEMQEPLSYEEWKKVDEEKHYEA